MDQAPPNGPKAYSDIDALAKCCAIIDRVATQSDRARVVHFLTEKYSPSQLTLAAGQVALATHELRGRQAFPSDAD